jgi:cell division protein FtsN
MEDNSQISKESTSYKPLSRSRLKRNYLIGNRIMLGIGFTGLILISIAIIQYLNRPSLELTGVDSSSNAEQSNPAPESITTQQSSETSASNNETAVISDTNDQQKPKEDSVADKSSTQSEIKDTHLETSSQATEDSNTQKITKKDHENIPQKYFLIAGSFDNEENATSLIAELSAKGFHPISIGKMGNSYKVAISSHADKSEANAQKSKLLEKGIETWILKK